MLFDYRISFQTDPRSWCWAVVVAVEWLLSCTEVPVPQGSFGAGFFLPPFNCCSAGTTEIVWMCPMKSERQLLTFIPTFLYELTCLLWFVSFKVIWAFWELSQVWGRIPAVTKIKEDIYGFASNILLGSCSSIKGKQKKAVALHVVLLGLFCNKWISFQW